MWILEVFGTIQTKYIQLVFGFIQEKLEVKAIFSWNDGEEWYAISTDRDLTKGKWYHLAGVYNQNTGDYSFYLDGEEQSKVPPSSAPVSQSSKIQNTTIDQYIGQGKAGDNNWNGSLDEFRIYNRSLSEQEIRRLAFR